MDKMSILHWYFNFIIIGFITSLLTIILGCLLYFIIFPLIYSPIYLMNSILELEHPYLDTFLIWLIIFNIPALFGENNLTVY